jgi:NADH dehydrogenase
VVGRFVGDVVITREEIGGLMAGLLYTTSPAAGATRLSEWLQLHGAGLGKHYASELARRTPS